MNSEEIIKAHNQGLHGFGKQAFVIIDMTDNTNSIVFTKEEDADRYIAIRKHAGWKDQFQKFKTMLFTNAILDHGPSISEVREGCSKCEAKQYATHKLVDMELKN